MKKKSGLSVIELLITLGVMSALLILVVQVGKSWRIRAQLTTVVNNFLADFAGAKMLASAENRYVTIRFNADGTSYTISKQVDISESPNINTWDVVKTHNPIDKPFFEAAGVADIAVNSMGEVRAMPVDMNAPPTQLTLRFFIKKEDWETEYSSQWRRTIQIYPYGGIKVETPK